MGKNKVFCPGYASNDIQIILFRYLLIQLKQLTFCSGKLVVEARIRVFRQVFHSLLFLLKIFKLII